MTSTYIKCHKNFETTSLGFNTKIPENLKIDTVVIDSYNLREISLVNCNLKKIITSWHFFNNLKTVDLRNNNIKSITISSKCFENFDVFNISGNKNFTLKFYDIKSKFNFGKILNKEIKNFIDLYNKKLKVEYFENCNSNTLEEIDNLEDKTFIDKSNIISNSRSQSRAERKEAKKILAEEKKEIKKVGRSMSAKIKTKLYFITC